MGSHHQKWESIMLRSSTGGPLCHKPELYIWSPCQWAPWRWLSSTPPSGPHLSGPEGRSVQTWRHLCSAPPSGPSPFRGPKRRSNTAHGMCHDRVRQKEDRLHQCERGRRYWLASLLGGGGHFGPLATCNPRTKSADLGQCLTLWDVTSARWPSAARPPT